MEEEIKKILDKAKDAILVNDKGNYPQQETIDFFARQIAALIPQGDESGLLREDVLDYYLVCHGAAHNDTLCVADRKISDKLIR